jgi:hypothetical protein
MAEKHLLTDLHNPAIAPKMEGRNTVLLFIDKTDLRHFL